jgi:hypothetical protein
MKCKCYQKETRPSSFERTPSTGVLLPRVLQYSVCNNYNNYSVVDNRVAYVAPVPGRENGGGKGTKEGEKEGGRKNKKEGEEEDSLFRFLRS